MKIYNLHAYRECDTCAKKAGSPILCSGCLNNREAIADRDEMIKELSKKLEIISELVSL